MKLGPIQRHNLRCARKLTLNTLHCRLYCKGLREGFGCQELTTMHPRSCQSRHIWRYIPVILWVIFTSGLAGWWYLFSVQLLESLMNGTPPPAPTLERHVSMLTWEGAVLLTSIIGGGACLAYFMIREMRERDRIATFLSTFTHELRTPLASLRLQAESLEEDIKEPELRPLVTRLVSATGQLTMQLENSLLLASVDDYQFLEEQIELRPLIEECGRFFALTIHVQSDAFIRGDRRALRAIFENVLGNAALHGKASTVTICVEQIRPGELQIQMLDDGIGFPGNRALLTRLFSRPTARSGNGIGLYLVRKFTERMGGSVEFPKTARGFCVALTLPGRVLGSESAQEEAAIVGKV